MSNGQSPQALEETRLSGKQKKFIESYLGECNLNATRAAITAGYSEKSAAVIGHENLRKPNIRRAIDDRLSSNVLTASESLSILSIQAKGTISDVLDENGRFDLERVTKRQADRLIKKLKVTEKLDSEGNTIERTYDLELHDAQAAAEKVGRFHKLFIDKREVSGSISTYAMTKDEWEREANLKLNAVSEQLEKFNDDESDNSEDAVTVT